MLRQRQTLVVAGVRTATFFAIAVLGGACAGQERDPNGGLGSGSGGLPTGSTSEEGVELDDGDGAGEGVRLDVGAPGETEGAGEGGGQSCPTLPPGEATLSGIVYAPNREIPVSGALVYLANDEPEGIPPHVYCSECVELGCDVRYTLSEPDGSFTLQADPGAKYLVVQKGQFMRVTALEVAPGDASLPIDSTSLPDHDDPAAGLYIPKIALALGRHDNLENALGKLGLGEVSDGRLHPNTQQFDIFLNGQYFQDVEEEFADVVADAERLSQYHIVFVPCTDDLQEMQLQGQALENVRDWVAKGGKWYVADWSAEYVEVPFGQYQTFYGEPTAIEHQKYDTVGTVLDPDLLAWLEALPAALKDINPLNPDAEEPLPTMNDLPRIELVDNWSGVSEIHPVLVQDEMGDEIDVGHHVWVEGPGGGSLPPGTVNPMSMTAEYGCGRIMFTTYHTVQAAFDYEGLTPQELVLMYLILEIGVCQTPTPVPPPAG